MKVSCLQMNMKLGCTEENFVHAKQLIRDAMKENPDMLASILFFALAACVASFAAIRVFAAPCAFFIISSKLFLNPRAFINAFKPSITTDSTAGRASGLPSFVLV